MRPCSILDEVVVRKFWKSTDFWIDINFNHLQVRLEIKVVKHIHRCPLLREQGLLKSLRTSLSTNVDLQSISEKSSSRLLLIQGFNTASLENINRFTKIGDSFLFSLISWANVFFTSLITFSQYLDRFRPIKNKFRRFERSSMWIKGVFFQTGSCISQRVLCLVHKILSNNLLIDIMFPVHNILRLYLL